MTDTTRLKQELYATRLELARKRIQRGTGIINPVERLSYVPERDESFLRLQQLSVEELEVHIERLKRDIDGLHDDHIAPATDEC